MDAIFSFVQSNPTTGIMTLQLVIIMYLVGGKNLLDKIRGVQKQKYPALQQDHFEIMNELAKQNKLFLSNHINHEIPEMKSDIKDIKIMVTSMQKEIGVNGQRISRIEGKLDI